MSIRFRLISFFTLLLLFIAGFDFIYYSNALKKQTIDTTRHKVLDMAERVAWGAGIGLGLNDFTAIGEALDWSRKDKDLSYIGVFDSANEEIASLNPDNLKFAPGEMIARNGVFEFSGRLFAVTPVQYRGDRYGNVVLGLSLSDLHRTIAANRATTFFICFAVFAAGFATTAVFSDRLSKPIVEITKAIDNISHGNLKQEKLSVRSSDEVGRLGLAFNRLLDHLGSVVKQARNIAEGKQEPAAVAGQNRSGPDSPSATDTLAGEDGLEGDLAEAFRKMKAALREREERIHSVVSNAMDGIITIYDNGIVESYNLAAEGIFGWPAEEVIGKSVALLMPEPYRSEHEGYIRNYLVTGKSKVLGTIRELSGLRKNGETFPLEISASEMRLGGQRLFIGVVRDITKRKMTEEELRLHRENLERLVEERTAELSLFHEKLSLTEKLSATGKLSASIAHEFNNPIYGIRNVLEQIGGEARLDETHQGLVQMAIKECKRITHLVAKLRDFYRPSPGVPDLMDLHEAIDDVIALNRKRWIERKIIVAKNYAPKMPKIEAVPDQIKQVILNLVQNAEEAISREGGEIAITTAVLPEMVEVQVRDTGDGIAPEHIRSIFQPFFTTKSAVKGTGLGLSVSYGIIKSHGGDIRVESQMGKGAIFTVDLPLKYTGGILGA